MVEHASSESGLSAPDAALFAHDLKNLLTTVLGHADIQFIRLDDIGGSETDLGRSLEAIRLAAGRAVDVCEDLLAVARGGLGIREPVDLGEVASIALQLLEARADREVLASVEGPNGLSVPGNRLSLERAVLNLLWNAWEAAADGAESPEIRVRWGGDSTHCWLEVHDNGPGLPEGRLGDLLSPYRSSKRRAEKEVRGLGLHATAEIMRSHGGRLTGTNAVQGGAVLRLDFGVEQELDFGSSTN